MFVKPELYLVRVALSTVAIKSLMHGPELARIATEVVSIFGIVHFPDLILSQFHIVKLMIIEIKIILTRYLLLIFFIRKLIMHCSLLILSKCLHSWCERHHGMRMPRHLMYRNIGTLFTFDELPLIFMHWWRQSCLLYIYLSPLIGREMMCNT